MIEVQYNPSTGEAFYDVSSGSQQTVKPPLPSDPCEDCPLDPFINFTISDVLPCCSVNDAGTESREFNAAVFTFINAAHFLLLVGGTCKYEDADLSAGYKLLEYDNADCSGTPTEIEVLSITLSVQLDAFGFYDAFISALTADFRQVFIQRWYQEKTGSESACFNEELIDELEETCGDPSAVNSGWTTIAENGIWDMT